MTAVNKTDIYRAIIAQIATLRGTKVKFAGFTRPKLFKVSNFATEKMY